MELKLAVLNVQCLILKYCNKLQCPEIISIFDRNDIIMFTEAWSNESVDLNMCDFQHFPLHNQRGKSAKRDSGGIIINVRDKNVNDKCLFFQSEDDILWLRLDGGLFSLADDLFIGSCYAMPESSGRFNLQAQNIFDRLFDSVSVINNSTDGQCNILLSGDFNSRTSDNADFIHFDGNDDFNLLLDDYTVDITRPRFSQDKGHTNSNGMAFVDFCKQSGLLILNGRCGDDASVGKYTFVGSRDSSMVDYVFASESLFNFISSFTVHDPNSLTDHCLIEYTFQNIVVDYGATFISDETVSGDCYQQVNCTYRWNTDLRNEYV